MGLSMIKRNYFVFILGIFTSVLTYSASFASCVEFEKEADAIEGAVPRFDDNGKLISISVYGDATFVVAKRSLISKARRKAERVRIKQLKRERKNVEI